MLGVGSLPSFDVSRSKQHTARAARPRRRTGAMPPPSRMATRAFSSLARLRSASTANIAASLASGVVTMRRSGGTAPAAHSAAQFASLSQVMFAIAPAANLARSPAGSAASRILTRGFTAPPPPATRISSHVAELW